MDPTNTTQSAATIPQPPAPNSNEVKYAPAPFSEEVFLLMEVCLRCYANGAIATLGVFSNCIVLIVFYRQGIFSNSSTVSLTALGIVDFLCSLLNLWGAILAGILFYDKHYLYPFWVRDFFIFTSARPNDMLTQITCWVTAYAAFERLISVIFPFKVKSIFTPIRSCIGIILLSALIFLLYCPSMFSYIPRKNTVFMYGLNLTHIKYFRIESEILRKFAFYTLRFNTIGLKAAAIITVVLCNVTIYWKVNLSQKFRKETGPSSITKNTPDDKTKETDKDKNKKENKEKKLLKMITAISIVFVTCYTPFIIFSILVTVVWEWRIDYHPFTEYLLWSLATLFQTVNSSTNFFIYYVMSTRFREEFQACSLRGKRAG